ncbi:hypothetical protein [Parvularcula lutaonensis]|uniref:Uncharacterized protein n=1 Tax=Parvularcula lutaonensis TaxID=491923 RepID=A0ABV7M9T3_9PROT|nr:hypothetical protein [Parvularcula lutaonensis]GGY36015.1 hypothetical protein GCM10007148_00120 [Parvularcula lutaonensis]
MDLGIWAIVGFSLAAYAVVGNDALQTLGTFINSNRRHHWTVLFGFAAAILVATFTYGWIVNGGDPSYGRLANTSKYPPIAIEWYHCLPPLVLVLITRLGIPVSTSFMVLTIFASVGGLGSMIEKSLIGYGLAFAVGLGIWLLISQTLEKWFEENDLASHVPMGLIGVVGTAFFLSQYYLFGTIERASVMWIGIGITLAVEAVALLLAFNRGRGLYWVVTQWATTGYLWSIWLIQDFANIFVFLPRELSVIQGFGAVAVIVFFLALTFANAGGPVQRILRTKTNVIDIRSATLIDFAYASLLFFFKELSDIPMSTTWVFLGLIAGREYGFALTREAVRLTRAVIDTAEDLAKAFIGIVVSVDLAVGLPLFAQTVSGNGSSLADAFPSDGFKIFVIATNIALIPVFLFAFSQPEDHPEHKRRNFAMGTVVMLMTLFGLNFAFPVLR